jgi:hypothetical protein
MRRGDYSGMTERELAENVIDVSETKREEADDQFERKMEEDGWSDHSSDVDESATVPSFLKVCPDIATDPS